MGIFEDLLAKLVVENPGQEKKKSVPGSGRMAELMEKYGARIDEMNRKGLRPGAQDRDIAIISCTVSAISTPPDVIDLYRQANGEYSRGYFARELEFMRTDHAIRIFEANQRATQMGLLPADFATKLPFMRDSIGNQFVVNCSGSGSVDYVSLEELASKMVANRLLNFFTCLVAFKLRNDRFGSDECPGDFRDLTNSELEILSTSSGAAEFHDWVSLAR